MTVEIPHKSLRGSEALGVDFVVHVGLFKLAAPIDTDRNPDGALRTLYAYVLHTPTGEIRQSIVESTTPPVVDFIKRHALIDDPWTSRVLGCLEGGADPDLYAAGVPKVEPALGFNVFSIREFQAIGRMMAAAARSQGEDVIGVIMKAGGFHDLMPDGGVAKLAHKLEDLWNP